jgi:hypothetical protein
LYGVPGWLRAAALTDFAAAGIAIGAAVPSWTSDIQDGQYVLRQPGGVQVVDRATYDRALNRYHRIFLGIVGLVTVGGAAACAAGAASRPVTGRRGLVVRRAKRGVAIRRRAKRARRSSRLSGSRH